MLAPEVGRQGQERRLHALKLGVRGENCELSDAKPELARPPSALVPLQEIAE
jgi:hypothetical protein